MQKTNKAFLFDLNGTMIDDMQYHVIAWRNILNELGASLTEEKTKEQCYGKNEELIERVFPGRFSIDEKNSISLKKEKAYQQAFAPQLKLIDGLDNFLKTVKAHRIKLGIGSAAIRYNIDFVLEGLQLRDYFPVIISAEDVQTGKPHPETYLKCAAQLGIDAVNCIVFEDSPKGVEAAARAGMQAVVITTMHAKEDFAMHKNIIAFIEDYKNLDPLSL